MYLLKMNKKITDSSLFIGQNYFNNNGVQPYLILQLLYYTLKRLGDTEKIASWKSQGLSAKKTYYSYHY